MSEKKEITFVCCRCKKTIKEDDEMGGNSCHWCDNVICEACDDKEEEKCNNFDQGHWCCDTKECNKAVDEELKSRRR